MPSFFTISYATIYIYRRKNVKGVKHVFDVI